jgi:hypothetical protein
MATALVIPAKAGIQRLVNGKKALDPSFRWDDDQVALNLLEKFSVSAYRSSIFSRASFSPDSSGRRPE